MSIISKLKGGKKDLPKAQNPTQTDAAPKPKYKHVPTHALRDAMGAGPTNHSSQEQIAKARLSRPSSIYSTAPSGFKLPRSNSTMSGDWSYFGNQASSASSVASMSRSSSYNALSRIPYEVEPVPSIPPQYASQAPSVRNSQAGPSALRPTGSRASSYHGLSPLHGGTPAPNRARFSALPGKSPLSSHETSPVVSEEVSSASSSSSECSHETSATSTASSLTTASGGEMEMRPSPEAFPSQPQRKYFTHSNKPASSGVVSSATLTPPAVEMKKKRFSFMKKGPAVAAH